MAQSTSQTLTGVKQPCANHLPGVLRESRRVALEARQFNFRNANLFFFAIKVFLVHSIHTDL